VALLGPAHSLVPLIEAHDVAKSFEGVPALVNGRLTLQAGSVHALCGGNGAGKSTFLNILMGLLRRDSGEVRLRGQAVQFGSAAEALRQGVAIITQELSPIPGMSVAENIYLGREPRRAGVVVDYRQLFEQTAALLSRLGFSIDPKAPMSRLSLAQTQLVEIAKAFSLNSEILIMDEPTSAIGEHETDVLFQAIRNVTAQGVGIIYVSHRLSEIFTIADTYTVFRDGGFVETGAVADIDRQHLVRLIVGRELSSSEKVRGELPGGPPLLDVSALSRQGEFSEISLSVAAGEVVGIYGLMGSGRSEFLNCIYGLTKPGQGQVSLRGARLAAGNPANALRAGLALITEDRKATGLVLSSSVGENISLSRLPRLSRFGIIRRAAERGLIRRLIEQLRVKTASADLPVSSMSGGNQQKVVLARCMSTDPVCLLCDEPTRGIDEGSKREIYTFLRDFAAKGGAVLAVSSEAQEVLAISDRIAIFRKGRLVEIIDGHSASQEALLHLAS
jgi:putative xylitol transport system ATP-binding protein